MRLTRIGLEVRRSFFWELETNSIYSKIDQECHCFFDFCLLLCCLQLRGRRRLHIWQAIRHCTQSERGICLYSDVLYRFYVLRFPLSLPFAFSYSSMLSLTTLTHLWSTILLPGMMASMSLWMKLDPTTYLNQAASQLSPEIGPLFSKAWTLQTEWVLIEEQYPFWQWTKISSRFVT